jgi:hypothetical protein
MKRGKSQRPPPSAAAERYAIPEPEPIDPARIDAIAARHRLEILGPPLSA